MPAKPIIFDISLPRTGTRSPCTALEHLGFRTIHGFYNEHNDEFVRKVMSGRRDFSWIKEYDALSHMGYFWRDWKRLYPDAKFICLKRDIDPWLDSCKRKFGHRRVGSAARELSWARNVARSLNFRGSIRFEEELFTDVYHEFNEAIDNTDFGGNLLVTDAASGWHPLCDFLGVKSPKRRFPKISRGGLDSQLSARREFKKKNKVVTPS